MESTELKTQTQGAPLAGIRVLEMGQMIAVPAAAQILASYGAEVIKIEDTAAGDGLRYYGSQKNGMSGWFANANWGKRAIALDIKTDGGKSVLWRLIESADVFVEGYRAGVMTRLGFGYEAARARNPKLVYCSSSGFGPTGPYADQPVYDPLIQSLTGWAGIQQQAGTPNLVRAMVADKVGAYTNAQAILAALVQRGMRGAGSHVQVNMLEANLAFVWSDVMMDCTLLDDDASHLPNVLRSYRLYGCSDGQVAIAPGNDKHWQSMCEALGPQYYEDERFHTFAGRGQYNKEWMDNVESMVSTHTVDEVVGRLRAADVPVAPVLNPHQVHEDPHILATGMLKQTDHPVAGRIRHPRPASSFFGVYEPLLASPSHGEHSKEILAELGFSEDQTDTFIDNGHVKAGR